MIGLDLKRESDERFDIIIGNKKFVFGLEDLVYDRNFTNIVQWEHEFNRIAQISTIE